MTDCVQPTAAALEQAAALLRAGDVVALPTETVYGLAGNALDERALLAIFKAKARPLFDPLIAHLALPVHTVNMIDYLERSRLCDLSSLRAAVRDRIDDLLSAFWPGPLTIVLPRRAGVPDLLTSGLPSVALRMPAHPVAQAILQLVEFPLAAPSANRFGRISPTTAAHVKAELDGVIPLIVDGGPCRIGVESTIVGLAPDGDTLLLLRPGGLPVEDIATRWGQPVVTSDARGNLVAPGQLPSHYSPRTPMTLVDSVKQVDFLDSGPQRIGVLAFAEMASPLPNAEVRILSTTGALDEAARNLFRALRELDESGVVEIIAERCPITTGLGLAINDRLTRAATK